MSRVVRIIGAIDTDSFKEFSEQISELEKTKGVIEIELTSGGGDTYAGLAFYGRIRRCLQKTRVTVYGYAMSAATIILVGADYRRMHKDSYFMVHDDVLRVKTDKHSHANSEFCHAEELEWRWATILGNHTTESAEFWRGASKCLSYMTADVCKVYGVIDEVVE